VRADGKGSGRGAQMQAYSLDLRERIVAAVDAGHARPEVARRFSVSPATISNYLRLRQETGGLAPRPRGGGQPEIGPAQYPQVVAQLEADPDATLAQHCERWAASTGQVVSVSTMWRTIERTGWSYKKRRWGRPSATR
jgi:transposase